MAVSKETLARLIFSSSAIVLLMYGIYFTLTLICIHFLLGNRTRNWVILSYTIATFLVTTIFLVASTKYVELIFIESAIDPLKTATLLSRLDLLQQVTYSIKIWLADSLLIYRLWVIWTGKYAVVIAPSIFFTGSFAAGVAGLALFNHADKASAVVNLGVAFHSCSIALNVLATSLIAGKLLYQRHLVRKISQSHGGPYLSLTAVFAESGAIYSITGLVYIPLYATSSPYIYPFAALLEAASGIAPALIILRIALGVAVSRQDETTRRPVSDMQFKRNDESRSAVEFSGLTTSVGSSDARSSGEKARSLNRAAGTV